MVARINTVAFSGMDVQSIDVQVQISSGLPAFTMVGYNILRLFSLCLFFMGCLFISNRALAKENNSAAENQTPAVGTNKDVCAYFDPSSFKFTRYQNTKIITAENQVAYIPLTGSVYKLVVDGTNSGKLQNFYIFYSETTAFNGSYLIYFANRATENDFQTWLADNSRDPRSDDFTVPDNFPDETWPGYHIVNASSLKDSVASAYRSAYTRIIPVTFENRTYFYFSPNNRNIFPAAVVGSLDDNGKVHVLCAYKERPKQW